ncbi:MAG: STAS/SEC14 domain-containing protein [Pseudomonadota bacterium]
MLTITKPQPNRVDIELHGSIDADGMRTALDELIAESEGVSNGHMLYRISEFEMPTAGAIAVEFSRLPGLFGLIGKFDRCAVLSDAAWLRTAADIEGALFPGISIKSFNLEETDKAEGWLSGQDAP